MFFLRSNLYSDLNKFARFWMLICIWSSERFYDCGFNIIYPTSGTCWGFPSRQCYVMSLLYWMSLPRLQLIRRLFVTMPLSFPKDLVSFCNFQLSAIIICLILSASVISFVSYQNFADTKYFWCLLSLDAIFSSISIFGSLPSNSRMEYKSYV